MSQAKLTLRPPPNIDFVQGYPGIPPGAPDRPQAAVKGAIEVRVGPQGVKAKWVRIELRKVETLPGGGIANTFFDFVGQSPINLWQASEEYANLATQDFPFYIRIPESIPPSIALEKGAGIKYELIATVCLKGKKGFLRRDKPTVLSTTAPIVIDKHELHSTWPVYAQAETRHVTQDGAMLTVERAHTCYGPGDRIAVMATVKADNLHTIMLRGFEFSLRETTVFRAGPNQTNKRGSQQVKVGNVGEQKVPVNAPLYGGQQHRAELAVTVPPHHTSTTLNAARHIDITYVLTVKALMATGKPLIMDLPVIISNWPRAVSVEAVRRIGLASNVMSHTVGQAPGPQGRTSGDLPPPAPIAHTLQSKSSIPNFAAQQSTTLDSSTAPAKIGARIADLSNFNTAPVNGLANAYNKTSVDEFGVSNRVRGASVDQGTGGPQVQTISGTPAAPTAAGTTASGARPRSSGGRNNSAGNRLTVANYADDVPEEVQQQQQQQLSHSRQMSLTGRTAVSNQPPAPAPAPEPVRTPPQVPGPVPQPTSFMTAEQEKQLLYERAKAQVDFVQSGRTQSPPAQVPAPAPVVHAPTPVRDAGPIFSSDIGASPVPGSSAWASAEEEKVRMYNMAQATARKTQGFSGSTPDSPGLNGSVSPAPSITFTQTHNRTGSYNTPRAGMSAGAALYSQAMSSINRNPSASVTSTQTTSHSASPQPQPQAPKPAAHFPSAEEEKLVMRRFYEAKAAVDRNQNQTSGYTPPAQSPPPVNAPISYDALYPTNRNATPPRPSPPANGQPPSFNQSPSGSSQPQYLSEKERLRRAYEAQDAAAVAQQQQQQSGPPPPVEAPSYYAASSPPPAPYTPPARGGSSVISEKEMLRRKYEAQDAAALASQQPPAPPPRLGSSHGPRGALPTPRGAPPPPLASASSSRPLTAAEEKARLKAMYEAEERGGAPPPNGMGSPPPLQSAPPPFSSAPPPFASGYGGANGGYANGVTGVHRQQSVTTPSTPGSMYTSGPPSPAVGGGVHRQGSVSVAAYASIPPPPPLMPRPPKEYIRETQAEDERIAQQIDELDREINGSASTSASVNGNGNGYGGFENGEGGASGSGNGALERSMSVMSKSSLPNIHSPPVPSKPLAMD